MAVNAVEESSTENSEDGNNTFHQQRGWKFADLVKRVVSVQRVVSVRWIH